jgi:hypothetical protein
MSKDLSIQDIVTRAIVTDVPKNSVIVLSVPTDTYHNDPDTLNKLGQYIGKIFPNNAILIIEDGRDPEKVFDTISEEKLNQLGWYKK